MEKGIYAEMYWFKSDRNQNLQSILAKLGSLREMNPLAQVELVKQQIRKNLSEIDLQYVTAWRCPTCGEVRLYTEISKESK